EASQQRPEEGDALSPLESNTLQLADVRCDVHCGVLTRVETALRVGVGRVTAKPPACRNPPRLVRAPQPVIRGASCYAAPSARLLRHRSLPLSSAKRGALGATRGVPLVAGPWTGGA